MDKTRRLELQARRRELHDTLLDHDHRDGPEDGCVCAGIYKELNEIWALVNEGRSLGFVPRAGPRPPGSSEDNPGVELENWQYLKDQEPQDAHD